MKTKDHRDAWVKEFQEFSAAPEIAPPVYLSESLKDYVSQDLNPSYRRILTKLAFVFAPVGSLSLLICSQFGVGRGHLLSDAFMSLGHLTCMAICGSLFLGLPMLAALFVLTRSEVEAIRRQFYLPVLSMGILSLFVFFCLGAEITTLVALSWLAGGVATGILATEAGRGLPRLLAAKRN